MKKKLATLIVTLAALAGFAGTCIIQNVGWTVIDGEFTYGAEIVNDTGADFLATTYEVAFVDDGDLVDVVQTPGCLRSWQDGATNFYSASTDEGDPDDTVALSKLKTFTVGDVANGELELEDVAASLAGDTLTVTGTLENDDVDEFHDARACAVVYNDDDEVMIVAIDNDDFDLQPGDPAETFTIDIDMSGAEDDMDHVDVWGDALNADEDNVPIAPASDRNNNVSLVTPTPTGTATPAP